MKAIEATFNFHKKNQYFYLNDFKLVLIKGKDAAQFCQGQLTNNIQKLENYKSQLTRPFK